MKKLRVRRGVLQTPVVRYRHGGTGRTVTLVGTMHVGEPGYYDKLHATVMRLEAAGAIVCYESIRPAADVNTQRLCRRQGWVEQGSVFAGAPSWRNGDLTDLELVSLARPEIMSEMHGGRADVFRGSLTQDQSDALAAASAAVVLRLAGLDRFDLLRYAGTWDDASRHFNHVSIEVRNARALATLPSDADGVLLWGAGHLPGFVAALKESGYRRRATSWVDVGRLPGLWASTRIIFKYYPAIR